jgi:hypothetical protein
MTQMKRYLYSVLAIAVVLGVASESRAAIIGTALGTAAPPATLGGYSMTAFGNDTRGVVNVTSVGAADGAPLGHTLSFGAPVSHREVPSSWLTWSHGYTGDVYYTNGATTLTMTLSPGAGAFIFYAEPNPFQSFTITATDSDGGTIVQTVSGSAGAAGYGLHTTGGSTITTVTVTSSVDFAVGEFSIAAAETAIPEPATITLLGLGAVGLAGYRLRRRKAVA